MWKQKPTQRQVVVNVDSILFDNMSDKSACESENGNTVPNKTLDTSTNLSRLHVKT